MLISIFKWAKGYGRVATSEHVVCGVLLGLSYTCIIGLVKFSSLMPISWMSITLFILANLCLAEIIFRKEPKVKNPSLSLVFWRKILAIYESLLITVNFLGLIFIVKKIEIKPTQEIIEYLTYFLLIFIAMATIIILGYLWLKNNQKVLRE